MARKSARTDAPVELFDEDLLSLPSATAAAKGTNRKPQGRITPKRRVGRYINVALYWSLGILALLLAVIGALQAETFLSADRRFLLVSPPEIGEDSPSVQISGLGFASRSEIMTVFERDFGRSIYRLPLAERRREIMNVSWIKDATIVRVWPNQIRIAVTERSPVAFVRLTGSTGSTRYALIDAEGAILEPRGAMKFELPVIEGIAAGESPRGRAEHVRRFLNVLQDAGDLTARISEINVADPNNIQVTQQFGDHAVTLLVGHKNIRQRLLNFQAAHAQIRERTPQATFFDLRIDGRVVSILPRDEAERPLSPAAAAAPAPPAVKAKPAQERRVGR